MIIQVEGMKLLPCVLHGVVGVVADDTELSIDQRGLKAKALTKCLQ